MILKSESYDFIYRRIYMEVFVFLCISFFIFFFYYFFFFSYCLPSSSYFLSLSLALSLSLSLALSLSLSLSLYLSLSLLNQGVPKCKEDLDCVAGATCDNGICDCNLDITTRNDIEGVCGKSKVLLPYVILWFFFCLTKSLVSQYL